MKRILVVALAAAPLLGFFALAARADVKGEVVDYKCGDAALQGYLVADESVAGKRPGVLVVHEWWGLNDYPKHRAEELAKMGYVAFAVDIYGKGVVTTDRGEATKLVMKYKGDRKLLRERINAGLEVLKNHKLVDPDRIAAIGYCFGGTTVLELARSGAKVAGIVAFHAGLDTPTPEDAKNIKCKVLALNGGDDASANDDQLSKFQKEMRDAKVDWQVVQYGGAVHGFTNPANPKGGGGPVAYDEKADKRSWEAMKVFFAEIFAK